MVLFVWLSRPHIRAYTLLTLPPSKMSLDLTNPITTPSPQNHPRIIHPRPHGITCHLKCFATQPRALIPLGPANTPWALLNLITCFTQKKVAPLSICVVRRTPRAMTMTAHRPPNLRTSLLIPVAETGLRVDVGLLTSRIEGDIVTVWVT